MNIEAMADAIFNELCRGTLDQIETIEGVITVQVIYVFRDDIPRIADVRKAVKSFGLKSDQVWSDKDGTYVSFNFDTKSLLSENEQLELEKQIKFSFSDS